MSQSLPPPPPPPPVPPPIPQNQIEDLLHRRTDLSTFLVHFIRDFGGHSARENLLSILDGRRIEARSVYGMMKQLAEANAHLIPSQQCVCFTETPLEHAWMMCEDIADRAHPFGPYGIAFTKSFARRQGVNPVWYIDQTPGHDWLTRALDELRDMVAAGYSYRFTDGQLVSASIESTPIARLAPFIEQMGPTATSRKEFWWEREWRKVGALTFSWGSVVAAFAPEGEQEGIKAGLMDLSEGRDLVTPVMPALLDPRWGLERMIASLAEVPESDIGPFPT